MRGSRILVASRMQCMPGNLTISGSSTTCGGFLEISACALKSTSGMEMVLHLYGILIFARCRLFSGFPFKKRMNFRKQNIRLFGLWI